MCSFIYSRGIQNIPRVRIDLQYYIYSFINSRGIQHIPSVRIDRVKIDLQYYNYSFIYLQEYRIFLVLE